MSVSDMRAYAANVQRGRAPPLNNLFCHPNTVRHRLRRIEKHTGRSLSRPRDVAELCLMFEVWRQLM
jgi:sugar diacid utilization regulator